MLNLFRGFTRSTSYILTREYSRKTQILSKLTNEYIYDAHPRPRRELCFTRNFDDKKITVEIAAPEDFSMILDFYNTYFRGHEALNLTLNMSIDEANELFTDILTGSDNILIRHDDKIVGMNTIKKYELKERPKEKHKILDDYGKIIDAGSFKHRTNNLIATLLEAAEGPIYEKLETPCIYYESILGAVHPKYVGQRIADAAVKCSISYALKNHARYFFGISTSDISLGMHLKMPGMIAIDKFPYAAFKDHGRKPLERVVGGFKYAHTFFLDIEKHRREYE